MIFVDTNIILDLVDAPGPWRDWSSAALMRARRGGRVVTGPVVVGELAGRGAPREVVLGTLAALGVATMDMDANAGHRAGFAFRDYRLAGGARDKMIADFLIGGQASVTAATLLTRDPRPFRRYFPELQLITPEDDNG